MYQPPHETGHVAASRGLGGVKASIVAGTFFGWLGLDMRVEVEPDAVRIYYWRTAAQGQEQAAKVRMALRDVAPAE